MNNKEINAEDKISVVVPCYNEEDVLLEFYNTISMIFQDEMKYHNYEVVFVDDGSKDQTGIILEKLSEKDRHIHFVSLSRNFGKESAMYAGLQYADGKYTVIMDADLQHPPRYIPQMYKVIKEHNYDMVATRRKKRGNESKFSSFCSESFYRVMNKISGVNMGDNAMDFRMLNLKAKNAIVNLKEYNRFSKGIFEWVGFRTYWLEIEIDDRAAGESKWSFAKLLSYAIEGCVAYSTLPLHLSSLLGIFFCLLAFVMIVIMVIQAIVTGSFGSGYATIICVMLLIGGVQLLCLGILGQYLAKDYLENKKRPIYLVQKSSKDVMINE